MDLLQSGIREAGLGGFGRERQRVAGAAAETEGRQKSNELPEYAFESHCHLLRSEPDHGQQDQSVG